MQRIPSPCAIKKTGNLFGIFCSFILHFKDFLGRNFKIFEVVNPFHPSDHFLYPLKTSENHRFSDDVRGCRKEPLG